MNQEVFQKGKLYFTKDGQAVMTDNPSRNLRLSDDYVRKEMPYAKVLSVPSDAFLKLQAAANREGKYSLNHVLNSYFK